MRSMRRRLVIVAVLGALAAAVAELVDPGGSSTAFAILGAAVAAGELLVLRPAERAPLPLSYAVMLVLVRVGSPAEFLVTVFAAEMVAYLLRPERSRWDRVWLTAIRLGAAVAALGAFHAVVNVMSGADGRWVVLTALLAAGVAEILVDDLLHVVRVRRFYLSTHGRSADLALITGGMLMSIGYRGIGTHEGMG